ncbi:MAG: hypothetical protein QXX38_03345 [Candidatus Aenigmatarchaeota archaeon]
MQAKCICPNHGRLDFDEIIIKNGVPVCGKCSAELQFGIVKPRFDVNKKSKK